MPEGSRTVASEISGGPPPWPRRLGRVALAVTLFLLGLWIARDFLVALAWAVVIAIATWPLYTRWATFHSDQGRRGLAPLLFTLLTGIALLAPLALIAVEVGREGRAILEWLNRAEESGLPAPAWLVQVPLVGAQAVEWWRAHLSDPATAGDMLGSIDKNTLTAWTSSLGTQLAHRLLLVVVTFMALFFLLRDGEWLSERLLTALTRGFGHPGERLAEKMVQAVRGTVNGTVLVALGEGAVIGLGYVVAGVPQAVLFGVLTAMVAMLPFGAWLAFSVASLVLLVQGGSFLAAAGLFGFGAAVMLVGDNFVQPGLIGGAARLPFLWALIGIFGGLQTFGLIGLFLGPVVMAGILTICREWIDPASDVARAGG
jgi:predicted PurR-regulated permease PerM